MSLLFFFNLYLTLCHNLKSNIAFFQIMFKGVVTFRRSANAHRSFYELFKISYKFPKT